MPDFYVYILKCNDGSYYTGHTDDIDYRISQHESGAIKTCYKYDKRPIKVVYVYNFGERSEAFAMERRIKGWSRKKKEALISEDFDLLVFLSNCKKSDLP